MKKKTTCTLERHRLYRYYTSSNSLNFISYESCKSLYYTAQTSKYKYTNSTKPVITADRGSAKKAILCSFLEYSFLPVLEALVLDALQIPFHLQLIQAFV